MQKDAKCAAFHAQVSQPAGERRHSAAGSNPHVTSRLAQTAKTQSKHPCDIQVTSHAIGRRSGRVQRLAGFCTCVCVCVAFPPSAARFQLALTSLFMVFVSGLDDGLELIGLETIKMSDGLILSI